MSVGLMVCRPVADSCLPLSQALKSCSSLASSRDQLRPEILECVLDVLG